jgi:magnesium transporter
MRVPAKAAKLGTSEITPVSIEEAALTATSRGTPSADPAIRAAAAYATLRVPVAAPGDPAGDVRDGLVGERFHSAGDIAVLEDGRLSGLVPIERLLAAPAATPLHEIMDPNPPAVLPETAQELAAWRMIEHGESSLAVVDRDGRFRGLVAPHSMLAVLLAEHDEDLARLGGYLATTGAARRTAEESVRRRLWHRLPWLLIGLVGAMISAVLVGSFEAELDAKVLLVFFLPGVIYMADAVGTQTETLLIRGLAVGVSVRTILRRELITGAITGLLVAALFVPFALAAWGDARVAVAVGLALLGSCSIATGVAILLPALFQRFGRDPAFGSGPLATVVQDLLSIAIYLAIAVPLAT